MKIATKVRYKNPADCQEKNQQDENPENALSAVLFYQRNVNKRSWTMNKDLVMLWLFLIVSAIILPTTAKNETRCGTIDIRNARNRLHDNSEYSLNDSVPVDKVKSCTVVEGSFILAMTLSHGNVTDEFPRFENLTEITGSLLIFMAEGLRSISEVLPNLRVIGGQTLIRNYALVVFRNDELEDLGLHHLSLIRQGGVRITNNKLLCHSDSIDWKHIIASQVNDVVIDDAVESSITETAKICSRTCIDDPDQNKCRYILKDGLKVQSCWDENKCHEVCPFDRNGSEAGPGCSPSMEKCHEQCVGGCDEPGDSSACYACKTINHQGKCIEKCPDGWYSLLGRRCVKKEKCLSLTTYFDKRRRPMKAIHGKCTTKCPENYEEDPNNPNECLKCASECQRVCSENFTINSYASAQLLKGCHVIDGSLTIEVRSASGGVTGFAEAFTKIHTINGYLMISHTPTFMNLFMFKNLRRINGIYKYRNKYALSVYENANLNKLFDPAINLTIAEGRTQFFNNRFLCFHQIELLMIQTDKKKEIQDVDQSYTSNGDKAICEESTFDVTLTEVGHDYALIEWPSFNTSDMDQRKFLGYEVYYKKVEKIDRNMSIYDNRSACSDTWSSIFVSKDGSDGSEGEQGVPEKASASLTNLRAYTIYAYYVTTQMVHHEGARNAISKIGFATTLFSEPSAPKIHVYKISEKDVEIRWEPPERPNGVITHYQVSWREFDADLLYYADKFCDETPVHQTQPDLVPLKPDQSTSLPSTTNAPSLTSFIQNSKKEDVTTCSAVPGCCECAAPVAMNTEVTEEGAEFENDIQNLVFVRRLRRRRAIEAVRNFKEEIEEKANNVETTTQRLKIKTTEATPETTEKAAVVNPDKKIAERLWKQNVTTNSIIIMPLKHFTEYSITVSACQDQNVTGNYCSKAHNAALKVKTSPIQGADDVSNETIYFEYINSTTSMVKVMWQPPAKPNGGLKGYKVVLTNVKHDAAPHIVCQPAIDGNWSSEEDGVIFKGLADGDYKVEVRAVSMYNTASGSYAEKLVQIYNPGFWTLQRIVIAFFLLLLFVLLAFTIGYYFVKKYYGKKVKEYATQLISANPEYLSQNDVYKPDEWELRREDLEIEEEIGSGTFGKVFRGRGKDVLSVCGETFGECAIKTVMDKSNCAEKLHFLLEANVMKKFRSSFIVKLYGVVSDGQPVLCVMEMMALGNLRDYLRSRRPGAEENKEDLSLPTKEQYHEWAAQIADGMAYLESIKFCHRDLAARNCMVHANETVKIGDFGMARDLYYHEYYKPTGKRLMPVRWMAPESLKDGKFDSKSDCWSYGIVLYEILTLGQQPYQGLANDEVLNYIGMSRRVLEKPLECPDYWYKIMKMCWRYEPRDRPTFAQLVRILAPGSSKEFNAASHVIQAGLGENPEGDDSGLQDEGRESGVDEEEDSEEPLYVEEPGKKVIAIPMKEMRSISRDPSLESNDSSLIKDSTSANSKQDDLSPRAAVAVGNEPMDDAHGDYVTSNVGMMGLVDPIRRPARMIIEDGDDYVTSGAKDNEGYCISSRTAAGDHENGWNEETERLTNGNRY